MPKLDYSKITSGIIQRGEELFPLVSYEVERVYKDIDVMMEKIPRGDERLMTMDEVLMLYD